MFCIIINFFIVTFVSFNASLLNKCIKKKNLTESKHGNGNYQKIGNVALVISFVFISFCLHFYYSGIFCSSNLVQILKVVCNVTKNGLSKQ